MSFDSFIFTDSIGGVESQNEIPVQEFNPQVFSITLSGTTAIALT